MSTPEILVMCPIRPVAMARLEAAYTLHRHDEARDKPAFLAEHGPRCEAVVTNGHVGLREADLRHLPRLGIVACSSAGYESIDVAALHARGVAVTNTSDALCDDVADTALMLLLAARRDLVRAHAYVRSGDWAAQGMYPLMHAIRGRRAGILGLGKIGMAIARRLEPLGLAIGYTARSPKDVPFTYCEDVRTLAEWSDILLIAVPGGPATDRLVDAAAIEALGPGGTIVNVARGSVVDEPAMVEALASGRLGSAGLDVYASEPDPDPRLTALPNVTLYPHHASGTVETRDAMAGLVVDNLAAHFAGAPLLTPVPADGPAAT